MRWTRRRWRAMELQGGSMRPVSDHQVSRRTMLMRTAKSCGPDAPTLASSSRRLVGPTGRGQNLNPLDDGGKRARSPGRARHKPLKPLRAGMPGDPGVLVVTRVRSATTKSTRDRGCNGHPAFPTPSMGAEDFINGSGASRREVANSCLRTGFGVIAETKRPRHRHSGAMRSIEPGISRFRVWSCGPSRNDGVWNLRGPYHRRVFARPVGSQ